MKPSEEELLKHNGFVKQLALRLVQGDEDDAQDLTQEVILRALLSPPSSTTRGLRPWLSTVVRNAFRRRRRDARLRKAKEHLGFRCRPTPDPAEVFEREQLRRDVVRAVIELPAKQRDVILLRFYNDHRPREIAAIFGVPVETVKTRQKRGLASLRSILDQKYGSRENWNFIIAPIAGLPSRSGSLRKGESSVGTGSQPLLTATVAISVALSAVVVSTSQWGVGARESATRRDGSADSSVLFERWALSGAPRRRERRVQSQSLTARHAESARFRRSEVTNTSTKLRYTVLSEDGSSIDDASLRLTNASGRSLSSRHEDGSGYVFDAVAPGRWRLACTSPAHFPYTAEVVLEGHNSERREEIFLERVHIVPVRLVTPSGQLLAEAREQAQSNAPAVSVSWLEPRYYSVLASESEKVDLRPIACGTYHRSALSRYSWDPRTGRRSAHLELRSREGIYLHLVFRHLLLETRWCEEVPTDGIEFLVRPEEVKALLSEVTVRMVDGATSAPLPCRVMTRVLGTMLGSLSSETDLDGLAVFDHQVPGFVVLEARPATSDPSTPPWVLSRLLRVPSGMRVGPLEFTVWKPLVVPAVFRDRGGGRVRVQVRRVNLDEGYPFPLDMLSEAGWIAPGGRYEVAIPERGHRLLILATAIEEGELAADPQLIDTNHLPDLLAFEFGPAGTLDVDFTQEHDSTHFAEITNGEGLPVWASEVQGPSDLHVSLPAEQDYTLSTFARTPDGELTRIEERKFHLEAEELHFVY